MIYILLAGNVINNSVRESVNMGTCFNIRSSQDARQECQNIAVQTSTIYIPFDRHLGNQYSVNNATSMYTLGNVSKTMSTIAASW